MELCLSICCTQNGSPTTLIEHDTMLNGKEVHVVETMDDIYGIQKDGEVIVQTDPAFANDLLIKNKVSKIWLTVTGEQIDASIKYTVPLTMLSKELKYVSKTGVLYSQWLWRPWIHQAL